jgi:uncharacterized protein YbaR (Trm112 family)
VHIELIDVLRCPEAHTESTLVLAADRWVGREVVDGRLGCPVCGATYPIVQGGVVVSASNEVEASGAGATSWTSDPDAALRLAAQLDLRTPGVLVALAGTYALLAADLEELTGARCLSVNPPGPGGFRNSIVAATRLPLSSGALRGVALDAANASTPLLVESVRALADEGRLVAPATASAPAGVELLARDEDEWVGTARRPRGLVSLGRAGT